MPELPEVETTVAGIRPHVENQRIANIVIRHYQLRWKIAPDLPQQLQGRKISKVMRRGKYLLLMIDGGALIIHLGMSGSLRILTQKIPPKKHDHVDIELANKKILRFNDPRRFGAVIWTKHDPHHHPLLAKLGPEPLSSDFSGAYLFQRAKSRSLCIKSFIMDSHIVVGVGNIYASEALFMAGIHPSCSAKLLSLKRMEKLADAIRQILQHAISRGGTTIRDFINSDGKPGYFANELKVYGRAGLPCVVCHAALSVIRIGQRSTFYCPACQK